ncbi:MAG: ATP-dependent helicase, partial [Bacteroidales bacterium]|nr:ATP-dependent helicase [Bacteroidales bacterium]
ENYVHRVGRTGRGMEKGVAISFCGEEEKEKLEEIEKFLGKKIDVREISKFDYEETIDFSEENPKDWQALIEENENRKKKSRKKKKK